MPKTEEKKKGLKLPHQLVILFIIAALATLATYIVPAGVYDSIEMDGRKVIDAASFHYIDQTPVGPWTALLALPGGFVKNAGIIAMITFIAGAMQVINATKCIDASVGKLVQKYKSNLYVIVPLLVGLFTILGAIGINTPIIAFVPLALLLGQNLGGDGLVGVGIALFGMISGLAGGAFCTSSTAVAQGLVGLDVFTGWPLRVAASVVLWILSSVVLILYMRRLRKDPAKSILHGVEGVITQVEAEEAPALTGRRIAALATFVVGFVFLVYGATNGWGTYDAIPAIFMVTAVICGLICGFSIDKIVKEFIAGAKTMSTAGIIIAFATGINTSSPPAASSTPSSTPWRASSPTVPPMWRRWACTAAT